MRAIKIYTVKMSQLRVLRMKADLILRSGKIITVDDKETIAEAARADVDES